MMTTVIAEIVLVDILVFIHPSGLVVQGLGGEERGSRCGDAGTENGEIEDDESRRGK